MDFTVLLVGVVAQHHVAVLTNVVSVSILGLHHSAQSGIALSVVNDYKIYNYFVFHVKNLQ